MLKTHKVIHGNTKEALYLWRVQIHGYDPGATHRFKGIGTNTCSYGNSGFIFFVTFGITEIGNHSCYRGGTGSFKSVDPEKKLHKTFVGSVYG